MIFKRLERRKPSQCHDCYKLGAWPCSRLGPASADFCPSLKRGVAVLSWIHPSTTHHSSEVLERDLDFSTHRAKVYWSAPPRSGPIRMSVHIRNLKVRPTKSMCPMLVSSVSTYLTHYYQRYRMMSATQSLRRCWDAGLHMEIFCRGTNA